MLGWQLATCDHALLQPSAAAQVAVLLCLLDVASGMSYLHSLGIVHGGG